MSQPVPVPPLAPTPLTPSLGAPPDPAGPRAGEVAFLRATVELAPVGIVHLAPDGTWLLANEAFCRLVGRSRAELDGLTLAELTHPDDVAAQRAGFERLLRAETDVFRMTGRHVHRDGTVGWNELTARHVRAGEHHGGAGAAGYLLGVVHDAGAPPRLDDEAAWITERLQEQATELELTNETLQEQAVELEATNEQLRETQLALEAQSEQLARANAALAATADELAEREARWHTLAEAMPQLVWTCRADGWSDFSNQRWLDYTGQRQEETWGLGWMDVMHPDDRAPTLAAWEPAVARGEPFESYYRLRRAADGAYRWFLARATPQRDASGTITRWYGSCTDVHDARIAAEERETLLAAEREARAAAEAAAARERFLAHASELLAGSLDVEATLRQVASLAVPTLADWCAVDLVNAEGRFERLAVCHPDPALVRLAYELDARYPEAPASPHGRYNVLRTGEPEWMSEIPDAVLEAGARDAEHLRIIRALRLRSYVAAPLAGRDGVLGVLTFVAAESGRRYTEADARLAVELARRAAVAIENARLVAALRDSEARLQEQAAELELQTAELEATAEELSQQTEAAELARRAAEDANHAKTQFLATMSHELRTPLNAIGGYVDLLAMELRGPVTPEQRGDLDRIRRSGQHLLGLINDILNFAKLEAGQVEFRVSDVAAPALLADVEPLVAPQMRARRLAYASRCADASLTVRADAEKARQVLLNLLSNAVKFTEPGGDVAVICDALDAARVRFVVTDTGRGIPADQLERIFEPFVQVDRHRTQASQQGIGLGLAISRDLARAMGGELTAASTPGAGSTFTLVLPRGPGA